MKRDDDTKKSVAVFLVLVGFLQVSAIDVNVIKPEISKRIIKRNIVTYPPNSVFQVTIGISVEGNFERNVAGVGLALQHNAHLPKDAQTFFIPQVVSARLFSVYDHLKEVSDRYGFNGFECLKKMICQIGETPLQGGGLLEEIVTFVLTPSRQHFLNKTRTSSNLDDESEEQQQQQQQQQQLLESEALGKQGKNCTFLYPKCSRTPLDIISYLEYI